MDLIVPCAGLSSRYPGTLPKYLWPIDDSTMVEVAVSGVAHLAKRILIAVLEDHDRRWQVIKTMKKAFDFMPCEVLLLPSVTSGEAETVLKVIEKFGVSGPFFVKDSDSAFWPTGDTINCARNGFCCCPVSDYPHLHNLDAKSYAQVNDQGLLVGVAEKSVISGLFGCGGYLFDNSEEFKRGYGEMQMRGERYLSFVIEVLLSHGIIFHPIPCHGYRDYGTFESWEWMIHQQLIRESR